MKKFITLLFTHKLGLCKPFHWQENDFEHMKGWCPVLDEAYQIFKYGEVRLAKPKRQKI